MILLIDNYDSFTYNLYQYVGTINPDIYVVRNDKITISEIRELRPSHIILSPGPKAPKDAGITVDVIRKLNTEVPILGICLGHQSIGEAFGGKTVHAPVLVHGKAEDIKITDNSSAIFKNIRGSFRAARYHSLMTDPAALPGCIKVTAISGDGVIMAMEHKTAPTFGLQFHPESIMTPDGMTMLENFLKIQIGGY